MTSQYAYSVLPEQTQEDALHPTRLLIPEERPLNRVVGNLLSKSSLLKWTPPQQLPSPPPEGADVERPAGIDSADEIRRREIFREEVLLDFAALESSILRIQLIHSSNARERERYAAEKAKILKNAQAVRDNTASLRVQLAEAQRVLELRKGYDELAAKLINSKNSKPRAETKDDIDRLEKEIEELEHEGTEFETTWQGRREAFERVVEAGDAMMKVVKGIKDEPEKAEDEHMDEGDGDGEEGVKGGSGSRIGTPGPARTPREPTPLPEAEDEEGEAEPPSRKLLELHDDDNVMRMSSQVASPMPEVPESEDVEMAEEDAATLHPQPKTTAGMEVSSDQVATPAEGMEGSEDREPEAAIGVEEFNEDQDETNAVAVAAAPVAVIEQEQVATPATPADMADEMDES